MKCPNCGFNSFDYLEECKKCKLPLNPSEEHKSLYKKVPKKVHRKVVADPVIQDGTGIEKTEGYRDHGKRAVEPAVSDDIRDSFEDSMLNTETFAEEGIPTYYRPRESTQTPELGSDPVLDDGFEPHTPDPALYSESNALQSATNLPGVTDSKEDSESYSIAGLKLRAAAFVIDLVIVGIIAYLTIGAGFFIMSDTAIKPAELSRVFLPVYALLFFLASTYFIFLHYYAGRTLGKMVVGIKIISSEGRELGLWESFMRWVGYYVSAVFLFAGFIWSVYDQDSQAWHDKIAGTYVVIG